MDNNNLPYDGKKGKPLDEKYGIKPEYRPERREIYRTLPHAKDPEYVSPKDTERLVVSREAMPRIEDGKLETLNRLTPIIVGDLFDRVRFLEQRIGELKDVMMKREAIHDDMVADIDNDIIEKERLAGIVSDLHERRNLKLDISILRKEKRHENVQCWKDLLELMTELRTLDEQYQVESKIVGIFRDMRDIQ